MNFRMPLSFAIFWFAVVCLFLVTALRQEWPQARTYGFATADGTVDSIKIPPSKGNHTDNIDISYHFDIDGTRFDGQRVRFGPPFTSDEWGPQMVALFPPQSHPAVYYDPANPVQAVLIRGMGEEDLLLAMFMTPFALFMLLLLAWIINAWRKITGFLNLRILEEQDITRIRPSGWIAIARGGLIFGIGSIVGCFAAGFVCGVHGNITIPIRIWLGVLAVATVAAILKGMRIMNGREDVVIDESRHLVITPPGQNIPFKALKSVHVNTIITKGGRRTGSQRTDEVWLYYVGTDNQPSQLKLEKWFEDGPEARKFAAWLGARLNVPTIDEYF